MNFSKFHNSGFAEWMASFSISNPSALIKIDAIYDDENDVYSLNIYQNSNNCIESFNYFELDEITDDLKEATTHFPILIKILNQ
jgi:hypothetical protein